jgi:Terpene synthase family 2, C-terminal metal binding
MSANPTDPSLIKYPFRPDPLNALERREVELAAERLYAPLPATIASHVDREAVVEFVSLCSPSAGTGAPDASVAQQLACATESVMYTLLFNDSVSLAEFPESVQQFLQGFCNASPSSDVNVFHQLGKSLKQSFTSASTDAVELVTLMASVVDSWSAFVWESQRLGKIPSTREAYDPLRRRLISVMPFLQSWKVLRPAPPPLRARYHMEMVHAEALSTQIQFLANDLGSYQRDQRRGQQNAVLIEAKQRGCTLEEAWQCVLQEHDAAVVNLMSTLQNLPAEFNAYRQLLETCTWGNARALVVLRTRYANRSAQA